VAFLDQVRNAFRSGTPVLADVNIQTPNEDEVFARGFACESLLSSQGWKIALEWINQQCDKADLHLIGMQSSDPLAIIAAQRYARAYRELHDNLQQFLASQVEAANNLREIKNRANQNTEEPYYG
jgi:hypothetical protein